MIIGHPGTWQQFQFRPDNRGLNVMEMKSKYLHEQYLFEAQMLNLQQMQQQNPFMNGIGGGSSSEPTPTYTTGVRLVFNDTLSTVNSSYGFNVTSAEDWNNTGKFTFDGDNSNFETVEIVDDYTIILKGNELGLTITTSAFDSDVFLNDIIDVNDNCITAIGEAAFLLAALTNATLNAVTTINLTSFWNCVNLITVSFNSLVTIPTANGFEQGVFANCDLSGLANLDEGFPNLETAGGFSFYQTGLNNVRSSTLNSIGIQAFARSTNILNVDISTSGTITIRDRAFSSCTFLNTITIPSKIDWTSVTTQFLNVSETGTGVFNASDLSEPSVTYLETSPRTWSISSPLP
jgi:hypothetical protein